MTTLADMIRSQLANETDKTASALLWVALAIAERETDAPRTPEAAATEASPYAGFCRCCGFVVDRCNCKPTPDAQPAPADYCPGCHAGEARHTCGQEAPTDRPWLPTSVQHSGRVEPAPATACESFVPDFTAELEKLDTFRRTGEERDELKRRLRALE